MNKKEKAYLVLEDGTIYEGFIFGYSGYVEGEVVFNTGITGYQEILTDPSYSGQIVTMTYPQIGNYGYIEEDAESNRIQVRGFIVKEYCDEPNNFRSKLSIGKYLKQNKITGIEGIDTRALTKRLRNYGTMRGYISTESVCAEDMIKKANLIEDISKIDLVKGVSTKKEFTLDGDGGLHIGIVDYGMKNSIAHRFNGLGHKVSVFPYLYGKEEILSKKLDLLLLSNGPGDPKTVTYAVQLAKGLFGKIPLSGICLGHQILGLALGGDTYKLKFGHRGGNHPVRNISTKKVWITTQNHGYAVDMNSFDKNVEETHINLNDNTNEGLLCSSNKVFSVQFHPEAAPGPWDCRHIFNDFLQQISKY